MHAGLRSVPGLSLLSHVIFPGWKKKISFYLSSSSQRKHSATVTLCVCYIQGHHLSEQTRDEKSHKITLCSSGKRHMPCHYHYRRITWASHIKNQSATSATETRHFTSSVFVTSVKVQLLKNILWPTNMAATDYFPQHSLALSHSQSTYY